MKKNEGEQPAYTRGGQLCSHEGPHLKKFRKFLKPRAARPRMSNLPLKIQMKIKKRSSRPQMSFFLTEIQRGAVVKIKKLSSA